MATYSSATITNDTHVHAAKSFIASLDNKNEPIFAFAAKATPWGDIDEEGREVPPTASNSYAHGVDVIKNLLFAKPLTSEDGHLSLKRNDWKSGTVYKQWSINNNTIYNYPYVTVINPSNGECNVFMCIFNNYGAPSTVKPEPIKSFNLQNTSDKYVWRWLFDISKDLMDAWACNHYVPMPHENELSSTFLAEQTKYVTVDYQAHIKEINIIDGGLFKSRVNLVKKNSNDDENYLDPYDIFSYEVPDNPNLRLNVYVKHIKDPKTGYAVVDSEPLYEPKIDYIELVEDPATGVMSEVIHYVQEEVQDGTTPKLDDEGNPVLDGEGNQIMVPNMISRNKIFENPLYHYTISKIELVSGGENFSNIKIKFTSKDQSDEFWFVYDPTNSLGKGVKGKAPVFDIIVDPKFVLGRDPAADVCARFVTTKIKFKDTENMKFPVSIHYRQFGLIKNLRYKNLTKEIINKYEEKYGTSIPDSEIPEVLKIKEAVSFFDIVKIYGVSKIDGKKFEVQTYIESVDTKIKAYILYISEIVDSTQTLYIGHIEKNSITGSDTFNYREQVESYNYDEKGRKTSRLATGNVLEHIKHNISEVLGNVLYVENASNINRVSRQTELFLLTFEL